MVENVVAFTTCVNWYDVVTFIAHKPRLLQSTKAFHSFLNGIQTVAWIVRVLRIR